MKPKWLLWPLLGLLAPGPACGQFIDIRMSVKIIVHPTTSARPSGITDPVFHSAVSNANRWMAAYERGYRYRLAELLEIGGPTQGGTNGPSKWFGRVFRVNPEWTEFYTEAQGDSRYALRPDRINIYVATGFSQPGNSGGAMPIPPYSLDTGGQIFVDDGAWWVVHELGHFFGLKHTHDGEDRPNCIPGDDGIGDTPPDTVCWTNQDMVASYYFAGRTYAQLTPFEQEYVDNVFFNTMSYHDAVHKNTTEDRLSEGQLDVIADTAALHRYPFVSGRTWFVDHGNVCGLPNGLSRCSAFLGGPYPEVHDGIGAADPAGGDIVLIRPGNYNEHITINKRVTLRAPRSGWVTIGRP